MGYIKKVKSRLAGIPMVRTWYMTRYLRQRHRDRLVNLDSGLEPDSHAKARKRWLESKPDTHLTWGKEVPGHSFIKKVLQYKKMDSNTSILEIGPGYGRLLSAILDLNIDFKKYHGIDISSQNIEYLRNKFSCARKIDFTEGDIEVIKIGTIFDLVIASLTFKHFFPSFEKGLRNASNHLAKGGIAIFDLAEGNPPFAFHEEDGTFIRLYSKLQVKELVESCELQLVGFDNVTHFEGYTRLVTVARK